MIVYMSLARRVVIRGYQQKFGPSTGISLASLIRGHLGGGTTLLEIINGACGSCDIAGHSKGMEKENVRMGEIQGGTAVSSRVREAFQPPRADYRTGS
jgi:hypothetical protein